MSRKARWMCRRCRCGAGISAVADLARVEILRPERNAAHRASATCRRARRPTTNDAAVRESLTLVKQDAPNVGFSPCCNGTDAYQQSTLSRQVRPHISDNSRWCAETVLRRAQRLIREVYLHRRAGGCGYPDACIAHFCIRRCDVRSSQISRQRGNKCDGSIVRIKVHAMHCVGMHTLLAFHLPERNPARLLRQIGRADFHACTNVIHIQLARLRADAFAAHEGVA